MLTEDQQREAVEELRSSGADELTFLLSGLHAALVLRVAADTQPEDKQGTFVEMVAMIADDAESTLEISQVLRLAKAEKARREH